MLPRADPSPDLQVGVNTSPHTGASFSSSQGIFFYFFFLASQSFSSRKFSSVPAGLSSPRVSHLCSARPTPQLPPVSCPQQFLGLFWLSVRPLTGDSYLGLPWSWKTPRASPFSGHTSHRGHSPPNRAASRKTNRKKKTHSYHSPGSFPR